MGRKCRNCIDEFASEADLINEMFRAIGKHKKRVAVGWVDYFKTKVKGLKKQLCFSEPDYKRLKNTLSKMEEDINAGRWDKALEHPFYRQMLEGISKTCQRE